MKAVATQTVGRKRYDLVPQLKRAQCAGCEGWKGVTADGGNLCVALGEVCLDYPRHGWVEDTAYVAPAEPERPVTTEELEELEELEW